MKKIVFFVLLLITISACTATQPQPTNTPPPPTASSTPKPTPTVRGMEITATVAALRAREAGGVRFMTYNILIGGFGRGDSFDNIYRIISIIKTYDPDVLGIQEANNWDLDNYAITQLVADELDMNYIYCKGDSGYVNEDETFDTIIMTRFEILDSEIYPEVTHCMGRAEILLPDGQTLQVFNLHTPHTQCGNLFPKVIEITKPYMDGLAVMMGDFNVVNPAMYNPKTSHPAMVGCPEMLQENGWKYLVGPVMGAFIDQIWVSPPMHDYDYFSMTRPGYYLVDYMELDLASDHHPVAADIFIP